MNIYERIYGLLVEVKVENLPGETPKEKGKKAAEKYWKARPPYIFPKGSKQLPSKEVVRRLKQGEKIRHKVEVESGAQM